MATTPAVHRPFLPRAPLLLVSLLSAATACTRAPEAEPPRRDERPPAAAPEARATPGIRASAAVAEVAGETVRVADFAPEIAMRLYEIEVDLHSLLAREAERLAAARLLTVAARERGLDVGELLAAEVDEKVAPPTEADVDAYLETHPAERGDPETVRTRARTYLAETRRLARREAFEAELRERYGYRLLLEPPTRPVVRVDLDGAPMRGPEGAPVTVALFGAFGQPATIAAVRAVERLERERPGDVRFAFRHFLSIGDEASLGAAMLAKHAQAEGRFWELFAGLVALDGRLHEGAVRDAARSAGVDLAAFTAERRAGRWIAPLRRELAVGRRAGVDEPPVFFVNGRYVHPSFGYDALLEAVDQAKAGATAGR